MPQIEAKIWMQAIGWNGKTRNKMKAHRLFWLRNHFVRRTTQLPGLMETKTAIWSQTPGGLYLPFKTSSTLPLHSRPLTPATSAISLQIFVNDSLANWSTSRPQNFCKLLGCQKKNNNQTVKFSQPGLCQPCQCWLNQSGNGTKTRQKYCCVYIPFL